MNNLAIKEISEKLRDGTLSLFEKSRYKDFLEAVNNFPSYSANNQILIYCQDKKATMVCGYNDWQIKYNRHVVKGGKGIKILAPRTKKVLTEQKDSSGNILRYANGDPVMKAENKFIGFCTKTVFDVSQTAGDPVPSVTTLFSDGNVDGYTEILDILKTVSPAPVIFTTNRCSGFESETNTISIRTGLTQQQTIQKLLPSVASAQLYRQTGAFYETESLESESVAFIVAKHCGIDADYDFDYITEWCSEKDIDALSACLKIIREAAKQMISNIDKAAKEIRAA